MASASPRVSKAICGTWVFSKSTASVADTCADADQLPPAGKVAYRMCEVGVLGSILSQMAITFPLGSIAIFAAWLPCPPASTNLAAPQPAPGTYWFDQIEPSNSTHSASAVPSALQAILGKIACKAGSLPT